MNPFKLIFVLAVLVWLAGCGGCKQHPVAQTTYDQTTALKGELASVNTANADAADKARDAQQQLDAARAGLAAVLNIGSAKLQQYVDAITAAIPRIDNARKDVVAIAGDTGAVTQATRDAPKQLNAINENAGALQRDRDREHNTWGNKIERFVKRIFWWGLGIIGFIGLVSFVLTLTPAAPLVIGAVPVLGHIGAGLLTGFVPHVLHGLGWIAARLLHRHAPAAVPAVPAAAAST